jgi:hypothetical protein
MTASCMYNANTSCQSLLLSPTMQCPCCAVVVPLCQCPDVMVVHASATLAEWLWHLANYQLMTPHTQFWSLARNLLCFKTNQAKMECQKRQHQKCMGPFSCHNTTCKRGDAGLVDLLCHGVGLSSLC